MRKMTNLLLTVGALSIASLGLASPALAATSHGSGQVASRAQSTAGKDAHHTCPPWQFPYCDDSPFDLDLEVTPNVDAYLAGVCQRQGKSKHQILKAEKYDGNNGHHWEHGAYRCN